MSDMLFPKLIGETWPVVRELIGGSTIVQTSANGLEVRIPQYVDRKFRWTIPFDWLSTEIDIQVATDTFYQLFGFLSQLDGMFDSFLYFDPDDNTTTDEIIGQGDGSTKTFQLQRTLGGATDRVFGVELNNPAPDITPPGTLNSSGVLTYSGAPGPGTQIMGSFQYYWRVRLDTDNLEFENWAKTFWDVKALKFISCRA